MLQRLLVSAQIATGNPLLVVGVRVESQFPDHDHPQPNVLLADCWRTATLKVNRKAHDELRLFVRVPNLQNLCKKK